MILFPTPQPPDERICRLAFSRIKGINVTTAQQILSAISLTDLFTKDFTEVIRITGIHNPDFTESSRKVLLDMAVQELKFMDAHNIRSLFFTDEDYPRRLLECEDAPVLLYCAGKANLNAAHVVGIVGTRSATVYGVGFINKLVDGLHAALDDLLIVSGMALGCDIAGHRRALADGVPTVGIMAHGLDMVYPAGNYNDAVQIVRSNTGALLSDYPSGTRPFRGNFLARNRIIAGMVDALVVAESAADHGGALHTARLAGEYNREVFAAPGRTTDRYSGGCNRLIRNHQANMITCADDLIEIMGWHARPSEGVQKELFREFSPEEKCIFQYLQHNGDVQINSLVAATGIPVGRLIGMMMQLEIEGLVMSLPGSRYRMI